jgi:hypothetical protein
MSASGGGEGAERRERALAGVEVARVDEHRQDDELAVVLGGDGRHRRGVHHVGDRRELLRRGLGLGDEGGEHLGRRGEEEHPAEDLAHLVEAELEPRGDAEVPAAAADRPEQVRVVLGIDVQELAVRGHDLGGEQVVDRHAVLADEEADPATERDPGDADGAGVAEARREAVLCGGRRVLARGQAGAGPGGAPVGVDVERLEGGDVEDDPALGAAVARGAVGAAADRELGAGVAGEGDDAGDVGGVGGADDDGGPAVVVGVDDGARLVVVWILRGEDLALEVEGELGSGEHPSRVTSRTSATHTGIRCSAWRLATPAQVSGASARTACGPPRHRPSRCAPSTAAPPPTP